MIITSDTAFFEQLGWKKGEETPYAVMEFFNRCYEFALQEIGYKGTDKNILSAVIHLDETTPHLQLYYIPIVDTAKKKVYEKVFAGSALVIGALILLIGKVFKVDIEVEAFPFPLYPWF